MSRHLREQASMIRCPPIRVLNHSHCHHPSATINANGHPLACNHASGIMASWRRVSFPLLQKALAESRPDGITTTGYDDPRGCVPLSLVLFLSLSPSPWLCPPPPPPPNLPPPPSELVTRLPALLLDPIHSLSDEHTLLSYHRPTHREGMESPKPSNLKPEPYTS